MNYIKLVSLLFLFVIIHNGKAQTYSQSSDVISVGGGESQVNQYSNFCVIGEPFVNFFATAVDYEASIGFLYKVDVWTDLLEMRDNRIRVHPNPTVNYLSITNINSEGNLVRIFDMNGNSLIESNEHYSFDISKLPTGLYLLQVIDKNGTIIHMEKVVKN